MTRTHVGSYFIPKALKLHASKICLHCRSPSSFSFSDAYLACAVWDLTIGTETGEGTGLVRKKAPLQNDIHTQNGESGLRSRYLPHIRC